MMIFFSCRMFWRDPEVQHRPNSIILLYWDSTSMLFISNNNNNNNKDKKCRVQNMAYLSELNKTVNF